MQVTVSDVGHRFQDSPWLFRNLSAEFIPGKSYALTGPSGSGKSTLLSLIAGWMPAGEGDILREGVAKTNWVFQNSYGIPRRTAVDHVVLPFLSRGFGRREATHEALLLLDRFQLDGLGDRQFRELSGGEAQRLMFARAVAAEPELLLVDEPTAQLDILTTRMINHVIGELSAEGRIVIVATHDAETVDACDEQLSVATFASKE